MKFKIVLILISVLMFIVAPAQAKNEKNKPLPPGLQKNLERGKPLPPGWQKKLNKGEVLDQEVYEHGEVVVPVTNDGLVTIKIEKKLIRLIEKTREIVEVLEVD